MSHALFPTDVVIQVASKYLEKRKAYIHKQEESEIARRVKESQPGFLGRLFGCKPWTIEEARNSYEGTLSQEMTRAQGKFWANQARDVIVLAKRANENGVSTVSLSANLVVAFEKMGAFEEV